MDEQTTRRSGREAAGRVGSGSNNTRGDGDSEDAAAGAVTVVARVQLGMSGFDEGTTHTRSRTRTLCPRHEANYCSVSGG